MSRLGAIALIAMLSSGCLAWLPGVGPNRVFMTGSTYTGGEIEGLSGADEKCQLEADAYDHGGKWTAWLSNNSEDAIDRIPGNGPWENLYGTVVFNNEATLQVGPVNELGVSIDGIGCCESAQVWTGTASDGRGTDVDCGGWFDDDDETGTFGNSGSQNEAWTDSTDGNCDTARHLYCFSNN